MASQRARRRARMVGALGFASVVLASSCSVAADTDNGSNSEEVSKSVLEHDGIADAAELNLQSGSPAIDEYFQEMYEALVLMEQQQQISRRQRSAHEGREIEVQIAECMKRKGHQYTPAEVRTDDYSISSRKYVENFGFGITTKYFRQADVGPDLVGHTEVLFGPDEQYLATLDTPGRRQYYKDLEGQEGKNGSWIEGCWDDAWDDAADDPWALFDDEDDDDSYGAETTDDPLDRAKTRQAILDFDNYFDDELDPITEQRMRSTLQMSQASALQVCIGEAGHRLPSDYDYRGYDLLSDGISDRYRISHSTDPDQDPYIIALREIEAEVGAYGTLSADQRNIVSGDYTEFLLQRTREQILLSSNDSEVDEMLRQLERHETHSENGHARFLWDSLNLEEYGRDLNTLRNYETAHVFDREALALSLVFEGFIDEIPRPKFTDETRSRLAALQATEIAAALAASDCGARRFAQNRLSADSLAFHAPYLIENHREKLETYVAEHGNS